MIKKKSVLIFFLVIIFIIIAVLIFFFIFSKNEWADFIDYKNSLKENGEEDKNKLKTIFVWDEENKFFQKRQEGEKIKGVEQIKVRRTEEADFDQDEIIEQYNLKNGILTVSEADKIIWQSGDELWVDDFVLADSTGDGDLNLNLSVWKKGNFGASRPFWLKENDQSIKNHFFVYRFEDKKIKPVWHSSNLAVPNCEFLIEDIDADGQNELIVLEGRYRDDFKCEGEYLAVWQWQEWGFLTNGGAKRGFIKIFPFKIKIIKK